MHFPRPVRAEDFRLAAPGHAATLRAHVIGIIENQAPTRHLTVTVTPHDGEVRADTSRDIAKLALLDRHRASGEVRIGLVQGFQLGPRCAIATTVAHDCHQMIVVGTDDSQMAIAANACAVCNGGQVVVKDGRVIGKVPLPIAGLMSERPAVEVAREAASVLNGFRACGCMLNNPNMQLSLLGLVVIPELRISDRGLIDVVAFAPIPVLE